jgi:ankyrin repeat protein/L-ascorbate metabolism protein UlaG (beta-lactamase superfamily)
MNLKKLIIIIISLIILFTISVPAAELHLAAKNGDFELVKQLVTKDPKLLDSGNRLEQTALLIASFKGNLQIVTFLIDKGADIHKRDRFGASALHMASLGGNEGVVALLLSKGAKINVRATNGKGPLQMAFEKQHTGVIDLFLKRGIAINNTIDQFNRTLLHKSAILGKPKVTKLLLERGANINAKDKTQRTALDLAKASGHKGVIQVLRDYAAEETPPPPLEISYVANAGFVVAAGNMGVMIDSLFNNGYNQYEVLTKDIIDVMRKFESPFNAIKFLLVTHNHEDHFNVNLVETFMVKNKNVILISPSQVKIDLNIYGSQYDSIKHRTISVAPSYGSTTALTVKDLRLNAFRFTHGTKDIQSLGYVFELGEKRIAHLGDASLKENKDTYNRISLQKYKLDVAFIPFFDFMTPESRALIKKFINPKHIILTHIPPFERDKVGLAIQENKTEFPSVTMFKKQLDKKVFN